MQDRINKIIDEGGFSDDMARALLLKNNWNSGKAIKSFIEDMDYIRNTFGFEIGENEPPSGDQEITCTVCYCDYPPAEFCFLPDCGHGLCNICYTGYLASKVGDGQEAVVTPCPEHKCNMIVPERMFQELLNQEQYARYRELLANSFVNLSD